MDKQYMSGADRAAQEDAELKQAEDQFNGTPVESEVIQGDPQEGVSEPEQKQPETDWEKRYKDLQSYHDKSTNELKDKLKEAGVEPEETDKVAELEAQLAKLQEKDVERETLDVVSQAQEAVSQAHPDFVSVINSPDFANWIKGQPQVFQDAIYADRPDAKLAIDTLTLFKVQGGFNEQAQATQQEQMNTDAAMTVNGGHRETPASQREKVWTYDEIQSLTPSQYNKLEKEIDKAYTEGRIR